MGSCWVVWAALIVGQAGPGDEARGLVAGLSAPRKADRDRAARRLEELGDAARPVLLEVAGTGDLELRARVAAVLDAIEGRALGRPTTVRLDFREVPLANVLDAISERTGLPVVLQTWPDPRRGDRPITVVEPEPVTFWEAVARIAEAGEVRPELGPGAGMNRGFIMPMPANGLPNARRARPLTGNEVVLVPDSAGPPPPMARSGRFLVALTALEHHRDRVLPGPNGRPPGSVSDTFAARLQVLGEPGLTIGRVGEVERLEAVDDRGNSLVGRAPSAGGPGAAASPFPVQNGRGATPTLALHYPDHPGSRIARLAGVLPIAVVGSRPDPVTAPLDEASWGKPIGSGDVTLTVHEVRPVPEAGNVRVVDVSLTRPESESRQVGYVAPGRTAVVPPGSTQGWFEFVDAAGKVVTRVAAQPIYPDDGRRRSLRVVESQGRAAAVRYVAPAWATLGVPFEFRDLPMP